jgi:site-specific DNA recombinase
MNRTVIYARVSTEDQVEHYGLPTQLRACREHAARHTLNVLEEITDDGISGTILDRAGLTRIRTLVREGQVDVVLMLDVDRLSRELAHLLILKPEIERHARLEFVAANFEDSPSGRMFFGIRGVIAQYERELTRERTMRGKKERARAGLIVGGRVPYGYRYEQGGFIEDQERAPIVRRIFADYESGVSIRVIAKRLRAAGAPTWGGGKWGKSSVARILSNETYAGKAHYGTHRREGKLLRLRDAADRISVPVLALVTREQWERVQGRLAANPQVGRPSSNFLLRGILYCAKCGRKMNGESSRKSRSYRCAGRDSLAVKGERCGNQARIAEVDLAVWSALRRVFSDPEFLQDTLRRRESELRNIEPHHIEDLRKRLGKLRLKEKTVLTAMLDPDLAAERAAIKVLYKAAVEERRRVEAELARIESANQVTAPAVNWVNETAEAIRELMADLTEPATKQEFVRRLVTRAEWDSGEIRMFCVLVPKLSRSRL